MRYITYIVTRFNLKLRFESKSENGITEEAHLNIDYLKHRMELFNKYTFPSVKGQTDQEFKWLCLFSKETPEEIKTEVKKLETYKNFEALYLSDNESCQLNIFLRKFFINMLDNNSRLITVRLDNDDAIGRKYIEEIKKVAVSKDACDCAFNFVYGINYYLDRKCIKTRHAENNHFYALVSNIDSEYIHPYEFSHTSLKEKINVVNLGKKDCPVWMEVIHDSNYANGTSGKKQAKRILNNFVLNSSFEEIDEIISV